MTIKSFNLTIDPWLKVIIKDTMQEETVSLIELFENAGKYQRLAGEMRAQDLAVFRFLLAILTTVYSRTDGNDQPYDWLGDNYQLNGNVDQDNQFDSHRIMTDLLGTWKELYRQGRFTAAVTTYLKQNAKQLDLFGDTPFYQVSLTDYNHFVTKDKQITDKKHPGTVAVRQINRKVSESNNKKALFIPRVTETKDQIKLDELTRWLITYQNYTGVTDKSKVAMPDKYSLSAGWLYQLNPVFVQGADLFQTLILNLILINQSQPEYPYTKQRPVWEFVVPAYVEERKKQLQPNNLAELYTTWSRLLHIEWSDNDQPTIYSAGLPIFSSAGAFIEPMTTWHYKKKDKVHMPAQKWLDTMNRSMWRNFGDYVDVEQPNSQSEPGIVKWLRYLKDMQAISPTTKVTLAGVTLVKDDNSASQMPSAEIADEMKVNADVLFDEDPIKAQRWPIRIEDMIDLTQTIGDDYWHFANNLATIRNVPEKAFAGQLTSQFYAGLNQPFNRWLQSLTNDQDRDAKSNQWKAELQAYAFRTANQVVDSSSPRDISGVTTKTGTVMNIFTISNQLRRNVFQRMQ